MTVCITLDELFASSSDPYMVNGQLQVPRVVERSMATPERVSAVLSDVMRLRGVTFASIAEKSGIPVSQVRALIEHGQGCVGDLLLVCRVLGVKPVKVPHPVQLAKGL